MDLMPDFLMQPPSQASQGPSAPMPAAPPTGYPSASTPVPPAYPPSLPRAGDPQQPARGSAGAMWLWGGVFGLTFAVVDSLISLVFRYVVPGGAPVNHISLFSLALCLAVASFLAGALSKRVLSGLIAGLLLVVVSQALSLFISLAILVVKVPVRWLIPVVGDTLVAIPLLLLVGAGVGAWFGALGALLGRALARPSPTPTAARS
jgi:hypothetical protein